MPKLAFNNSYTINRQTTTSFSNCQLLGKINKSITKTQLPKNPKVVLKKWQVINIKITSQIHGRIRFKPFLQVHNLRACVKAMQTKGEGRMKITSQANNFYLFFLFPAFEQPLRRIQSH